MKQKGNYNMLKFIGLLLINFTLIWLIDHYVLTVKFYLDSNEGLSTIPGQDDLMYSSLQKWIYLTSAVYLLIKLFVVALLLYTALFLSGQQVSFKSVFNVAVNAEYLFFIPAIIKFIWFYTHYRHGDLADWHHVYILSALTLFDNVPANWTYALQTLNLFEFAYWFLLAYGVRRITSLNFEGSLRIVAVSYLPALIIWIATLAFCSLMISPATA